MRVKPDRIIGVGVGDNTVGSPAITAPDAPEGMGTIVSAPRMGTELAVKPVMSEICSFFVRSFFLFLPLSFFERGASRNSDACGTALNERIKQSS